MDRDRTLLFGLLALKTGKLSVAQLIELAAGGSDGEPELSQQVVAANTMSQADCDWLLRMVEQAMAAHGGDGAGALTALQHDGEIGGSHAPTLVSDTVNGEIDSDSSKVVAEIPGRYTNPTEHGYGGIGRVWMVRDEFLGREIALKELSLSRHESSTADGTDKTAQLTNRFLREARITGQLEHPSIIPVYEVGKRPHGGLYYTMKLVRGHTLGGAIKAAGSLRERLQLLPHFVDLCHAIGYAHSRGVLHRDVKPSNVMVGEFGETVVIDWGLAKVPGREDIHAHKLQKVSRRLSLQEDETTPRTTYGETLGTPIYMSPEQASGELDRVDERSDIYSLGAVLYELLAGAPPFSASSTSALLMKVAGKSPDPIAVSEPDAPLELVAICDRAMHPEIDKRYQTAKELAGEVQGFLSGGLVRAYQYRFSDHLRRFIARHRAIVGTVAASLLVLLVGLSIATGWSMRERRRAELEAETANQVSQFLVDIFKVSEPGEARRGTITAREILARGAAKIRQELQDQPLTQARLMATIGSVDNQLGLYDEAEPLLREALRIRVHLLGREHREVAHSLLLLAFLLHDQGKFDEAEQEILEARRIYEEQLGSDQVQVASCLKLLALVKQRQGRFEESEALHLQALEILEKGLGADSVEVALELRVLGSQYMEVGRFSEAEELVQRALRVLEAALGEDHHEILYCLNHLATIYSYQGKFSEAEPLFRRSLAIAEKTLGPKHQTVASAINNLAVNLWYQGRFDEIELLYLRAMKISLEAVGPKHHLYGTSLANLAELYWKQGRFQEAEDAYHEALTVHEQALGADHPEVAQDLYGMANLLRDQGSYEEAETCYRRSLAIREQLLSPSHPQLQETLTEYAKLLRTVGRDDEATKLEQRAARE